MKKIIFFVIVLISMNARAQNFQVGLKAGINISNFNGGDFNTVKNKSLLGYHAGAFMRFKFGHLALQPAVLLSTQGAKLEEAGNSENYKLSYVNIPVVLQYETSGGFYIEAGPQIGFKVSEDIPNSTVEDFAKSTDLAIALGLGYHSPIGLGIGARYNIGVSKVGDFDASDISPDFKNGVIQISLFYTIFNNRK